MENNKKLLGAVVLIAIVAIVGFLSWEAKEKKVVDETANWKTAENTKLNFSFKYPSANWEIAVRDDVDFDGVVLTPKVLGDYGTIHISKADCKSVIQTHPGKISFCKEIDDLAIYASVGGNETNLRTAEMLNKILSTFKFTSEVKTCGGGASAGSGYSCPEGFSCKILQKGPPDEGICVKQ